MNTRTVTLDFDVKTDTTHDNAAALLAEANLSLKIRSLGRVAVEVLDVRPAALAEDRALKGQGGETCATAPCENGMPDCGPSWCRTADDVPLCLRCYIGLAIEAATADREGRIAELEAENARLRHTERRFTEERRSGLVRDLAATRVRLAGLEADLVSLDRWLAGSRAPEPLDSVEREIAAEEERERPSGFTAEEQPFEHGPGTWVSDRCSAIDPATGDVCVRESGHEGRHRIYPRQPVVTEEREL